MSLLRYTSGMDHSGPIGVFDSGVGGLSVLRHIQRLLPNEPLLYLADQGRAPYGPRPAADVQAFSVQITHYLRAQGVKLIVVACNTASAAALSHLRATFPDVPFVGMEPAVKPGAAVTRNGRVGVLATVGTFDSQRYASLMTRFAHGVSVFEDPCLGLVEEIEAGRGEGPVAAAILQHALAPMQAAAVDTIILGCTHYPFVARQIAALAGPQVTVIDPAPAVARQAGRLLTELGLRAAPGAQGGPIVAVTSGAADTFAAVARQLVPELPLVVSGIHWPSTIP